MRSQVPPPIRFFCLTARLVFRHPPDLVPCVVFQFDVVQNADAGISYARSGIQTDEVAIQAEKTAPRVIAGGKKRSPQFVTGC